MTEGVKVLIIGMTTVFSVLLILYLLLVGMKKIFYKETETSSEANREVSNEGLSEAPVQEIVETDDMDEDELVAVLTAAVAACLNQSTYNLRIKSYRRIDQSSPVWNITSRHEQIANKL